jgi:hypothetical protein
MIIVTFGIDLEKSAFAPLGLDGSGQPAPCP